MEVGHATLFTNIMIATIANSFQNLFISTEKGYDPQKILFLPIPLRKKISIKYF